MSADWALVIITIVYVIATIAICVANFKTARVGQEQLKIAQAQLEESRTQFITTQRLMNIPFLQIEYDRNARGSDFSTEFILCSDDSGDIGNFNVKFRNIGNGTAANLIYQLDWQSIHEIDSMPINAIRAGDEYIWGISIDYDAETVDVLKPKITIEYRDLLENTYKQSFFFSFTEAEPLIENSDPIYQGVIGYKKSNDKSLR